MRANQTAMPWSNGQDSGQTITSSDVRTYVSNKSAPGPDSSQLTVSANWCTSHSGSWGASPCSSTPTSTNSKAGGIVKVSTFSNPSTRLFLSGQTFTVVSEAVIAQ